MSIDASVLGLWRFNDSTEDAGPLNSEFETISGSAVNFADIGVFNIFTGQTTTQRGLLFQSGQGLSAGSGFDFTSSGKYILSISFWWYSPQAVGQTRHAVTRQLTSKIAPIIAKATTSTSNGIESVVSGQGEFIVSEVGVSSTQNAIQFALCSNTNPTHVFRSSAYNPGLHHVNLLYENYSTSGVGFTRIDIDGQAGDLRIGPASISNVVAPLTLNSVGFGYTAHRHQQAGIISDLVVKKYAGIFVRQQDSSKMSRLGYQYITDSELISSSATYHGVSYTQPSTSTTNQIFTDGGNIYVARSNGELLKGFQPVWDNEYNYVNPNSVNLLNVGPTDSQRTVSWTVNGLQIKGTTVRV